MKIAEYINMLHGQGIQIGVHQGNLKTTTASSELAPELQNTLRERKAEQSNGPRMTPADRSQPVPVSSFHGGL